MTVRVRARPFSTKVWLSLVMPGLREP